MTRAEATAAMDAGKKIGWNAGGYQGWVARLDIDHVLGPYVIRDENGLDWTLTGAWGGFFDDAYIIPERKTRPCTQLEILAIQTKPNRVIREKDCHEYIVPAQYCKIVAQESIHLEWAEFDEAGNLGPWHDFVVEVEE